MALKKTDPAAVASVAKVLLLSEPAMAVAYTRAELIANSLPDSPLFPALRNSWHPQVSGDVQYALKPNWMFASTLNVVTHGSPYAYDTHVPLLVYAPNWYKPGRVDSPVFITSIALTLAQLLGVAPPPAADGKVLPVQAR